MEQPKSAAPANAGLDAVASEAASLDASNASAAAPNGEQPQVVTAAEQQQHQDGAQLFAMIPAGVGRVVVPAMPELAPVYSEQVCREWGGLANKWAEKKGWNVGDKAPGLMLGLASFSMVVATVVAIGKRIVDAKRQRAAAAAAGPAGTGTATAAAAAGGGAAEPVRGTGPNA